MEPTLHETYTVDEAVAAFGSSGASELLCDGQFVVLPTAVLCMATVGDPATQTHFSSPSTMVWRPGRIDYEPFDDYPWLPSKVREVWGPDRQKIKDHHVLVRLPGDEQFVYASKAHLGSYGGPRSGGQPWEQTATLPSTRSCRDRHGCGLGRKSGWLIEVNHHPEHVDDGDLATWRQLTAAMSEEFSHLTMTRYKENSLTLYTNARRGWLMYLRDPDDAGVYASDAAYAGDREANEVFRCVCGIALDFPADQTLPRDLAMRAAEEFFTSGELPQSAHWRPQ